MEKDPKQWVQFEQQGQNIGAQIMLNPAIFAELTKEVEDKKNIVIADIGAGTGSLSRELLLTNVQNDPALEKCADKILKVRKNISRIINIDNQKHYLDEGQKITQDERISFQHAQAHELPLDDESVDIVVSRQMLMHLSPGELQSHFCEITRVLRRKCAYVFTVTNPGVEHLKHVLSRGGVIGSLLTLGQSYQYPHGPVSVPEYIQGSAREIIVNMIGAKPSGDGTQHFLKQYFHTPNCYIDAANHATLRHEKMEYLHAVVPGFEKTHARYYWPALPTSILYKNRKPY